MIDTKPNPSEKTTPLTPAVPGQASGWKPFSYVLMTAAHNEEARIEETIQSVLAQTVLPDRWLIVSDNSTDRTNEIVQRYADQYSFIRFHRVTRAPGHSFASKIIALRAGAYLLEGASYDFIGNIDADITVDPPYFEELMRKFDVNPKLGIAGGYIQEEVNGQFAVRGGNREHSVSHAAQLVRREVYEAIGGYAVLKYGGEDWQAQTAARLRGWDVEAYPPLKIFHHRITGTATNLFRSNYKLGKLDYSFGSYPIFELIKCLLRIHKKPYIAGSVVRMVAFADSMIRREPFLIAPELVAHLRKEQKERMLAYFGIRAKRSAGNTAAGTAANPATDKGGRS
jgi:glycosyltransferase involved in cell wall biosynthesis